MQNAENDLPKNKIKLVSYKTGHIYKSTLWFSRKQHLKRIKQIIGDGECVNRDGSLEDYHLNHYIEQMNESFSVKSKTEDSNDSLVGYVDESNDSHTKKRKSGFFRKLFSFFIYILRICV